MLIELLLVWWVCTYCSCVHIYLSRSEVQRIAWRLRVAFEFCVLKCARQISSKLATARFSGSSGERRTCNGFLGGKLSIPS